MCVSYVRSAAWNLQNGEQLLSACRLNAQHYIWQQEIQYNLHPDIPTPGDGTRIADVATGTGAWLLETARAFPNVQFDGLDISLAQCPPKQCLPANVSFDVWDIFTEPPEELVGKYDIVHLRLVILVLRAESDLSLVLSNLAKLLKPGGYLQWDEMDLTHTVISPVDGSLKIDGIKRMDMMMKGNPASTWVPALPGLMESGGFENAKSHQILPRKELMKFTTDVTLLVWVERANGSQDPAFKKMCFGVAEEVLEEYQKGACHATAKAIVVARKI